MTLKADTKPQVIGSGATGQLTRGQRYWRPINSSVVSFDEKSIAYGCQLYEGAGSVPIPTTCTIQLASKKLGTLDTVVQDLVYNPVLLGNSLNRTTFGKGFTGLTETVATVADSAVPGDTIVMIFDTHAYDATLK